MHWVFWAFVGAAVIHVVEEFGYPGGFLDAMKSLNPKIAPLVTAKVAITINSLFLLLCVIGAIIGGRNIVFSLSVASLLFFNALIHIGGTVKARRYAPGVVSGIVLYLPLSLYAYYLAVEAGELTLAGGIVSGLLGVLYQALPVGYFGLLSLVKQM